MRETSCDVLIVGGGTGGCAAAMAASSMGMKVILSEETDWIGGQLTSQAVPPDEHRWIERFGCTARYRRYREHVRWFYRDSKLITAKARATDDLNPGGGWISRLCHEPRIGWIVLNRMLREPVDKGLLDIRLHTVATAASTDADRVETVTLTSLLTGDSTVVHARYVIDATELGDLLPMTGAEYVFGAESKSQTNEPNAVDGPAQPDNVQGLTWVFAMAHDPGSNRVIDKPLQYDRWRAFKPGFWPGPLLGFDDLNPQTGRPRHLPIFDGPKQQWYTGDFGLFSYRQVVDPQIFQAGFADHPVTIVNWPQNDYFVESIIDVPPDEVARRLEDAKQLSLSLLYWLQTEAPHADGRRGYPGLYLRPDITGTEDGFAKTPYIRESRRIQAVFTVLEQHVSDETHSAASRSPDLPISVGIGSYRIDLHPSTNGTSYIDTATLPFQIPLGSLIPVRLKNLLPACKNLGVTHITNGCYRLHPVEWNIGEAAGLLAAFSIKKSFELTQILESGEAIRQFQSLLTGEGIELAWPEDQVLNH